MEPVDRPRRHPAVILAWCLAAFAAATVLFLDPFGWHSLDERLRGETPRVVQEESGLWTCGMHPQVIQDEPGQCPICHMDLVPLDTAAGSGDHDHRDDGAETAAQWICSLHPMIVEDQPGICPIDGTELVRAEPSSSSVSSMPQGERRVLFYRNPMNPTVTSPVPAKDEMGMDYVPVYEGDMTGGTEVRIDPSVVQAMNVRTERVRRQQVHQQVRTVGYLEYDQERMVTVTTRYSGWVEKVYVHYLGDAVRKGQPLFDIYSPDLVQTQQELLTALDYAHRMDGAPVGAHDRAHALVDAARTRLELWDVTDAQIAALEKRGEIQRAVTVFSPARGVVMKTMTGLEGMAVNSGMELFHIADLSTLWLSVEAFEDQVAWIRPGTVARVTLTYFPGETFEGRVRLVAPEMSEQTRTLPVRLEIPNPDGRLRPGMYATVVFEPPDVGETLAVPAEAVLRTGDSTLVVVARGEGRFAPRAVTLGREGEGMVEITSGLEEGEEVVTSAQFLLDSESSLRAAIEKLLDARRDPPLDTSSSGHGGDQAGHETGEGG